MRPRRADDCVQRFDERGPALEQFFQPQTREPRKLSVSSWRYFNNHLSAIGCAMRAAQHSHPFEAIDSFHRRVMAHLQPFSDGADGSRTPWRHPNHSQNQLVLFGLKPGGAHRVVGSIQEQPDSIAEFSQRLISVLSILSHVPIISLNDINVEAAASAEFQRITAFSGKPFAF